MTKIISKKFLSLLLSNIILILCFLGCGCEDATYSEEEVKILTQTQAIDTLKNYENYFEGSLANQIAGELGFLSYTPPRYGASSATLNRDVWSVTIKGNMFGYTDEYRTKSDTKKFSVTAKVSIDGRVSSVSIREVYY